MNSHGSLAEVAVATAQGVVRISFWLQDERKQPTARFVQNAGRSDKAISMQFRTFIWLYPHAHTSYL